MAVWRGSNHHQILCGARCRAQEAPTNTEMCLTSTLRTFAGSVSEMLTCIKSNTSAPICGRSGDTGTAGKEGREALLKH